MSSSFSRRASCRSVSTMKLIVSLLFSFCIFVLILQPNLASEEENNVEQSTDPEVAETNQEDATEQEQTSSDEVAVVESGLFDINMINIITGPTVCAKGKRPDRRGKCRSPSF